MFLDVGTRVGHRPGWHADGWGGEIPTLANLCHDLRQPLQTIALMARVLGLREKDPNAVPMIGAIECACASLGGMLDNVLDLVRIQAGEVAPAMTAVPLGDLFDRLAREYGHLAAEARIRFTIVPTSLVVRSDSVLLERMLRNILHNALKFAGAGQGVLMGCRRLGDGVRIDIHDTGPGMGQDQLISIFDSFYRDRDPGRNARGLGLGLAIVRDFGRLLDHPVRATSRLGKGMTFSIEIKNVMPV